MKKSIASLFFISGITGLIYQLLWVRRFTYLLGSTYLTVSIIVAAFMGGLLIGAWLAGKLAGRKINWIRCYALLEIFIGIYAFFFVLTFGIFNDWFAGIHAIFSSFPFLSTIATASLIILIVLPPTCAMGATLPFLVEHFTHRSPEFKINLSLFYAVNTLGGAVGVLIAGFYLIEVTGITNGILIAGSLNILIGIVAFYLSGRIENESRTDAPDKKNSGSNEIRNEIKDAAPSWAPSKILLLLTAFVTGFSALGYEITWTRALKFLIQSSTYSFTIILFVFLLGIASGSWIAQRLMKNKPVTAAHYGLLMMLMSASVVFTIYFLYSIAYTDFFQQQVFDIIFNYSFGWFSGILIYMITCAITFLIPCVLMGILFPVLNQMYFTKGNGSPIKSVSGIYVVNTAGSIAGSLSAGFILIPSIGIKWSIFLLAIINLAVGIAFIMRAKRKFSLSAVVVLLVFFIVTAISFRGEFLNSRDEMKSGKVLYYKEGLNATVKVYAEDHNLDMSIDGMLIASTSQALLQKERLIAHLPFFIHPEIQSVLSVGLASGISTASMAEHETVKKIDCVELIKPVVEASTFFSAYNSDVLKNQKVHLTNDDIYAYLKFNDAKYDLISSDGKLGTLDNANTTMLSSDYYEECKNHLNDGGLFIQWIPLITPKECFDVILQTLKKSFNNVSVFYFYPSDVFMVASDKSVKLDLPQMNGVMSNPAVYNELHALGFNKASDIMCAYIGPYEDEPDENQINTMDRPRLEFLFYRDWKKSSEYEGGYRAANLSYLIDNFQSHQTIALQMYKGLPNPDFAKGIFNSSLNFYNFCNMNFKKGNYETGMREYDEFRKSIPF